MANTRANNYRATDPLTQMATLYGVRKVRKYLKNVNIDSSSAWRIHQFNARAEREQLLMEKLQRTAEEIEREEEFRRIYERNEELIDIMCTYTPFVLTAAFLIFVVGANFVASIQNNYDFL